MRTRTTCPFDSKHSNKRLKQPITRGAIPVLLSWR
nr:MAG TPA: hypothetical protein [Caudoviricetes sp.]